MSLESYFSGERSAGLLVGALGIAASAFAAWLWLSLHAFRMMTCPVALFAMVQIGVGIGLYVKTPSQAASISRAVHSSQVGREAEIARMERVNRSFVWIERAEVLLLSAGVVLIFAASSKSAWVGVGMGLAVQSAVMLVFDVFAQHRAERYLQWLRG